MRALKPTFNLFNKYRKWSHPFEMLLFFYRLSSSVNQCLKTSLCQVWIHTYYRVLCAFIDIYERILEMLVTELLLSGIESWTFVIITRIAWLLSHLMDWYCDECTPIKRFISRRVLIIFRDNIKDTRLRALINNTPFQIKLMLWIRQSRIA